MAQKKVFLSPTMLVMGYVDAPRSKTNPIWAAIAKSADESFKRALAAGVSIALGTDAGGFPWDQINEAKEFKLYVDRGMSTWQALRSGTVVAASLLGKESELGTVAPGRPRRPGGDEGRSAEGHHRYRARLLRDEGGSGHRPTRALSAEGQRRPRGRPQLRRGGRVRSPGNGHGVMPVRCSGDEPVKTLVKMVVVVSALSSLALGAEVDRREARQQGRIAGGVGSGQLTPGETARDRAPGGSHPERDQDRPRGERRRADPGGAAEHQPTAEP